MKKITLLTLAIGVLINLYSQNIVEKPATMHLLDGKKIELKSFFIDKENSRVVYTYLRNDTKIKRNYKDFEDIYSMTINAADTIFYAPQTTEELPISEMAKVVNGSSFAVKEYNPWWAIATGVVVGGSSMFATGNNYINFSIPIVYITGMYFAKPCKSNVIKHYPDYSNDDLFIQGYRNAGNKKIFKKTFIGTIGGMAVSGIVLGIMGMSSK